MCWSASAAMIHEGRVGIGYYGCCCQFMKLEILSISGKFSRGLDVAAIMINVAEHRYTRIEPLENLRYNSEKIKHNIFFINESNYYVERKEENLPPQGVSFNKLSPTITNLQLDTCSKDLDDSQELLNQLQIELEQQVGYITVTG